MGETPKLRARAGVLLPAEVSVVVLGAGPAGAATAIALRRAGIGVLLVESGARADRRVGETVPPPFRLLLHELGVWDGFAADGHLPSRGTCSAWGSTDLGYHDFLFSPHGSGFHLDRARFERRLVDEAIRAGADSFAPSTRLLRRARAAEVWSLVLLSPDGEHHHVAARQVVDATGRRAVFARAAGARRIGVDRLTAVSAFASQAGPAPFGAHALIEAVEDGFWYAAPLPEGEQVVVFFSDGDIVGERGLRDPEAWLALLGRTRHARRFAPERPPVLSVQAAASFCLDRVSGDGWLAVGDAAGAFDPLSSGGLTKALLEGRRGAEALGRALVGDVEATARYARQVHDEHARHLEERRAHYGFERRFDAPFWRRRHP